MKRRWSVAFEVALIGCVLGCNGDGADFRARPLRHPEEVESMEIAKTISYGGFFDLPGAALYTIRLAIQRPGSQPFVLDFKYGHRRQ